MYKWSSAGVLVAALFFASAILTFAAPVQADKPTVTVDVHAFDTLVGEDTSIHVTIIAEHNGKTREVKGRVSMLVTFPDGQDTTVTGKACEEKDVKTPGNTELGTATVDVTVKSGRAKGETGSTTFEILAG